MILYFNLKNLFLWFWNENVLWKGEEARWNAKSNYITKKGGSCGIKWEQAEDEQFIVKKDGETARSERFGVSSNKMIQSISNWRHFLFVFLFLFSFIWAYKLFLKFILKLALLKSIWFQGCWQAFPIKTRIDIRAVWIIAYGYWDKGWFYEGN